MKVKDSDKNLQHEKWLWRCIVPTKATSEGGRGRCVRHRTQRQCRRPYQGFASKPAKKKLKFPMSIQPSFCGRLGWGAGLGLWTMMLLLLLLLSWQLAASIDWGGDGGFTPEQAGDMCQCCYVCVAINQLNAPRLQPHQLNSKVKCKHIICELCAVRDVYLLPQPIFNCKGGS